MGLFNQILESIEKADPLHFKRIQRDLAGADDQFYRKADDFTERYLNYLKDENKTLDYAVQCYLQMVADMRTETIEFFHTGEYRSKSFDEVNKRVYNNPEVMEYFMNGLLLSQFLWGHHYAVLMYFTENLPRYKDRIKKYLEIGGGHGLYISEAIRLLNKNATFDLVDISPTSVEISRALIKNDAVNYKVSDIFDLEITEDTKYDFITIGEVIEHVEDPVALLKRTAEMLKNGGTIFVTTPTNAPTIDHIYLFRNAAEIRKVINDAGLTVKDEMSVYSEKGTPEKLEKYKVAMMYCAFVQKTAD